MDFRLTEEQRMLQREARALLAEHCRSTAVREWLRAGVARPAELWQRIAELGWLGLAMPLEHGGLGGGLVDLVLLHEVCGGALMPTLFRTTAWAALSILAAGDAAQGRRWLPRIVAGEETATVALSEAGAVRDPLRLETVLTERNGDAVLSGRKCFVENGADADLLIVSARRSAGAGTGVVLVVVPRATPGVRAVPCASFAGDPQAEVEFDAVAIQRDWVLGREGLASVKERMATLLCADMTGGLERVLELTAAYVKGREQFGRPIGSFQAVQHALADMATTLEGARYATYQAAWRLQQGLPAAREVAIAQAWTGPAYKNATLTAHQLHGGMGFVTEYDLYLYSNRAKAYESRLGGMDVHLETVAREVGL